MATHCSVLMCFRGMWWWGSILLVCFRKTWGRSIPLTLPWFTALKQFGGHQDIISWELLWRYWRRRGAFRFKWTVRKGCRIHLDGGSAWRDNNRLEWTPYCILRHNKFVWNRDIMVTSHWCMKVTSWQHLPCTSFCDTYSSSSRHSFGLIPFQITKCEKVPFGLKLCTIYTCYQTGY